MITIDILEVWTPHSVLQRTRSRKLAITSYKNKYKQIKHLPYRIRSIHQFTWFVELDHAFLEVAQRTLHKDLLLLVVVQQMIPQTLLFKRKQHRHIETQQIYLSRMQKEDNYIFSTSIHLQYALSHTWYSDAGNTIVLYIAPLNSRGQKEALKYCEQSFKQCWVLHDIIIRKCHDCVISNCLTIL